MVQKLNMNSTENDNPEGRGLDLKDGSVHITFFVEIALIQTFIRLEVSFGLAVVLLRVGGQ